MTIRLSRFSFSFRMPFSAIFRRILPSKEKGRLTIPMLRIFNSLLISAITGAAPEPVPPPSPRVIKISSAPLSASLISSFCSSAAFSPSLGFIPVPSPWVSFLPILIFKWALVLFRSCSSVFRAISSMPSRLYLISRETVLEPAPPIPTILIFGDNLLGVFII